MKRKLISLVLALFLTISIPISAFASIGFNRSVFNGRDDILVSYDDMKGITRVYSQTEADGKTTINFESSGIIFVTPRIAIVESDNDSLDVFELSFDYFGNDWVNLNEILIKIGDKRYNFLDCNISHTTEYANLVHENISFYLKNESLSFIQDFIKHQNSEIKVRLDGSVRSFDFILTDDMKASVSLLYNLFYKGNGTRKSNMDNISSVDQTVVETNNLVQGTAASSNSTSNQTIQRNTETVWIPTHGGTKYHRRSTCSGMEDPEKTTKDDAIRRGFDACQRCY